MNHASNHKSFRKPAALLFALCLAGSLGKLGAISDGDTATGATNPIAAGATVNNVLITGIDTAVQASGTANNFTVGAPDGSTPEPAGSQKKPTLTVAAATGKAVGANVYNNGLLEVTGGSGGTAGQAATLQVLLNTTIHNGGMVTLSRNTLATNTTIESGGYMQASGFSATADGATINAGGVLQVGYGNGQGAIAKNISVNGGLLAALMYGTSASNNGRGYIDGVEITNGGHVWLGSWKALTPTPSARNITVTNGNLVIWNNVTGADDISNVTVGANGIVRVLGRAEEYINGTVGGSVAAQSDGARITGLVLNGGKVLLRDESTLPYAAPDASKLVQTGAQTFDFSSVKKLTVSGTLGGNGTFHLGADLAAGTGDQVELLDGASSSFSGTFSVVAVSSSAPNASSEFLFIKMSPAAGEASTGLVLSGTVWYPGSGGAESAPLVVGDDALHTATGLGYGLVVPAPPTPWYENAAANAYAAAVADWYSELQPLQNRMGELRLGATKGFWAGTDGRRLKPNALDDFTAKVMVYGFQAGVDEMFKLDGARLYAGLVGSYNTASQELNQYGDGHSTSWSMGAYVTTLWNNGWYLDIVGKYQNQHQTTHINTPLGLDHYEYHLPGMSLSLEIGKAIRTKYLTLEPQLQVAAFYTEKVNYGTDGAAYEIDSGAPVFSRLGILAAPAVDVEIVKLLRPYARVSVINESNAKNKMTVTPSTGGAPLPAHSWEARSNGTGVEGALGFNARFNSTVQLYGEIGVRWGGKVDMPVGGNLGIRFNY
ncbi:MAG: autotransporter outer membrane beta-barrel domain-containing protein [Opitutaceae bacterium]|jgi:outer membrane autotransporter protein|nr:autotransporter outer membrane beta-barrel domain-containing protein [Opitutaceae bacterium]